MGFIKAKYMSKKYSEIWKEKLLYQITENGDRFCEIFYSYTIFSSAECIERFNKKRTLNYKNIELLYKIFAIYYTVNFSSSVDETVLRSMENYMQKLYNMNDTDIDNFKEFLKLNKENKLLFQISFVKRFSKDILYIARKNLQEIAFIHKLFDNSYVGFLEVYKKYMNGNLYEY